MPIDTPDSVRVRRAAMTDSDVLLGMIYEGALAACARFVGAEQVVVLRERCGIPKKLMSFLRYPAAGLLDLALTAAEQAGVKELDEMFSQIGEGAVASFFETPVGKTMLAINGGSPHRMLAAAPAAYKAVFSFGQRSYQKRGEKSAAVSYTSDFMGPAMERGILTRGIEISCKFRPTVVVEQQSKNGLESTQLLTW